VVPGAGREQQRLPLKDAQFPCAFDRLVKVESGKVVQVGESGGVGQQVAEGDRLPVLRAAAEPPADRVIER
jgi:hypothetical protein